MSLTPADIQLLQSLKIAPDWDIEVRHVDGSTSRHIELRTTVRELVQGVRSDNRRWLADLDKWLAERTDRLNSNNSSNSNHNSGLGPGS